MAFTAGQQAFGTSYCRIGWKDCHFGYVGIMPPVWIAIIPSASGKYITPEHIRTIISSVVRAAMAAHQSAVSISFTGMPDTCQKRRHQPVVIAIASAIL